MGVTAREGGADLRLGRCRGVDDSSCTASKKAGHEACGSLAEHEKKAEEPPRRKYAKRIDNKNQGTVPVGTSSTGSKSSYGIIADGSIHIEESVIKQMPCGLTGGTFSLVTLQQMGSLCASHFAELVTAAIVAADGADLED